MAQKYNGIEISEMFAFVLLMLLLNSSCVWPIVIIIVMSIKMVFCFTFQAVISIMGMFNRFVCPMLEYATSCVGWCRCNCTEQSTNNAFDETRWIKTILGFLMDSIYEFWVKLKIQEKKINRQKITLSGQWSSLSASSSSSGFLLADPLPIPS